MPKPIRGEGKKPTQYQKTASLQRLDRPPEYNAPTVDLASWLLGRIRRGMRGLDPPPEALGRIRDAWAEGPDAVRKVAEGASAELDAFEIPRNLRGLIEDYLSAARAGKRATLFDRVTKERIFDEILLERIRDPYPARNPDPDGEGGGDESSSPDPAIAALDAVIDQQGLGLKGTQTRLSRAVGVNQSSMHAILKGTRPLRLDELWRWCLAAGVNPNAVDGRLAPRQGFSVPEGLAEKRREAGFIPADPLPLSGEVFLSQQGSSGLPGRTISEATNRIRALARSGDLVGAARAARDLYRSLRMMVRQSAGPGPDPIPVEELPDPNLVQDQEGGASGAPAWFGRFIQLLESDPGLQIGVALVQVGVTRQALSQLCKRRPEENRRYREAIEKRKAAG